MIEHHLELPTADGAMNTFVAHPEEGGPHPVVLFFMDAPGKREELHDMARRIASVGYFVVLPNLYYRWSRDFQLRDRTPEGMKPMFELMHKLTNAMAVVDTRAMLQYVDAHPAADARRVGAVGYCMSGPFVFAAAAALPERIHCIAALHPANMVTTREDSPHRMCPRIRCETYVGCAETDKWCTPADAATLEQAMQSAGMRYRLEWYPGTEHGFTFPQRPVVYDKPSAERHWERLFALFERNLKSR